MVPHFNAENKYTYISDGYAAQSGGKMTFFAKIIAKSVKMGIKELIVHLGALNNVTNLTPRTNIFCESKLSWLDNIAATESFVQARV